MSSKHPTSDYSNMCVHSISYVYFNAFHAPAQCMQTCEERKEDEIEVHFPTMCMIRSFSSVVFENVVLEVSVST